MVEYGHLVCSVDHPAMSFRDGGASIPVRTVRTIRDRTRPAEVRPAELSQLSLFIPSGRSLLQKTECFFICHRGNKPNIRKRRWHTRHGLARPSDSARALGQHCRECSSRRPPRAAATRGVSRAAASGAGQPALLGSSSLGGLNGHELVRAPCSPPRHRSRGEIRPV